MLVSRTSLNVGSVLVITLAMWVIPSFGTQGVGIVGRELPHPDRALIATGGTDAATVDRNLQISDSTVRVALPL